MIRNFKTKAHLTVITPDNLAITYLSLMVKPVCLCTFVTFSTLITSDKISKALASY